MQTTQQRVERLEKKKSEPHAEGSTPCHGALPRCTAHQARPWHPGLCVKLRASAQRAGLAPERQALPLCRPDPLLPRPERPTVAPARPGTNYPVPSLSIGTRLTAAAMRAAAQSLLRCSALLAHQQATSLASTVQVGRGRLLQRAQWRRRRQGGGEGGLVRPQPRLVPNTSSSLPCLQAAACAGSRRWFATNSHDIFNTVRKRCIGACGTQQSVQESQC